MSKRNWRWVTREQAFGRSIKIWSSIRKPTKIYGWGWASSRGDSMRCCSREFKRLTGLTIPVDYPVRVVFIAKVVG